MIVNRGGFIFDNCTINALEFERILPLDSFKLIIACLGNWNKKIALIFNPVQKYLDCIPY